MSKRLQKTRKELRVFTVEAQEAIWRLAPRDWVGKRKAAIAGVARDLGWKFSRTWNMAHGRARRIDAHEMDALRGAEAKIEMLKEQAHANRARLNDLIYRRHEIEGVGSVDRAGGAGAADRRVVAGDGGSEGAGDRPAVATIRSP